MDSYTGYMTLFFWDATDKGLLVNYLFIWDSVVGSGEIISGIKADIFCDTAEDCIRFLP